MPLLSPNPKRTGESFSVIDLSMRQEDGLPAGESAQSCNPGREQLPELLEVRRRSTSCFLSKNLVTRWNREFLRGFDMRKLFLVLFLCSLGVSALLQEAMAKSGFDEKREFMSATVGIQKDRAPKDPEIGGKDKVLELACLKRAAQRGDSAAAEALGAIYSEGIMVPTDLELAYAWSEAAAV
jgi:hypothetical protein